MYLLSKKEIITHIDDVLSTRTPAPDITDIQRIKDATALELSIQQSVNEFPSKPDAIIVLKYTCQRYIKQFLTSC